MRLSLAYDVEMIRYFPSADGWKTDSDEKEMMPGDDDDSDGDWVDVPHLSDDEVKDSAVTGERVAEKRKVAQEVSSSRILSQEDFDRIRGIQLAREAGLKMTKSAEKMKRTAAESFTNDGSVLLRNAVCEVFFYAIYSEARLLCASTV